MCNPGIQKILFFLWSSQYFILFFLLFSVLKNDHLLRWPSTGEDVLTWHLLSKVLKKGFLSFFSVICWQAKSSLLVDPTCDSINPFYCFPQWKTTLRVHQKASHQRHFPSNSGHTWKKKSGSWTVSQTTEWKMSFVALVSAGRSRADTALQE